MDPSSLNNLKMQPMERVLYFVCPTDCLEPVINKTFRDENFFYTSLGNSVIFDESTTDYVKRLILDYGIKEIYFVLSLTNPIINDALDNQVFIYLRGLNHCYEEVALQDGYSEVLYRSYNRQFTVLSYYLNKKIKELQHAILPIAVDEVKVRGKIYRKGKNVFDKIYSDLVCTENFSLN